MSSVPTAAITAAQAAASKTGTGLRRWFAADWAEAARRLRRALPHVPPGARGDGVLRSWCHLHDISKSLASSHCGVPCRGRATPGEGPDLLERKSLDIVEVDRRTFTRCELRKVAQIGGVGVLDAGVAGSEPGAGVLATMPAAPSAGNVCGTTLSVRPTSGRSYVPFVGWRPRVDQSPLPRTDQPFSVVNVSSNAASSAMSIGSDATRITRS